MDECDTCKKSAKNKQKQTADTGQQRAPERASEAEAYDAAALEEEEMQELLASTALEEASEASDSPPRNPYKRSRVI